MKKLIVRLLPRTDASILLSMGFKKQWKPRLAERTTTEDHMNSYGIDVFEFSEISTGDLRHAWGISLSLLKEKMPYKFEDDPDYGDMMVGSVELMAGGEVPFYKVIFKSLRNFEK